MSIFPFQVIGLNEQEMKWICNHLGHTTKVHDTYYRQTSGLIERIDIAKLMLLQEHNLIGKYSNRKLSDVQFDGNFPCYTPRFPNEVWDGV